MSMDKNGILDRLDESIVPMLNLLKMIAILDSCVRKCLCS